LAKDSLAGPEDEGAGAVAIVGDGNEGTVSRKRIVSEQFWKDIGSLSVVTGTNARRTMSWSMRAEKLEAGRN
jgi:hypothetical protein